MRQSTGYLPAIVRQWRLLAVLAVLGAVGGAAYGSTATAEYSSTSQVLVALQSDGSTADRLQGANYVDSVLATYTSAVTSSVVLEPVISGLGLDQTLTELRRSVTASSTTGTAIVTITAMGESATQARAIVRAITNRFVEKAPAIVSPVSPESTDPANADALGAAGLSPAAVNLTVVDAASLPEKPDTPGLAVTILLGLVAGLLVGVAAALVRFAIDGRVRTDTEIEEAAGAAVLGHLPRITASKWADRESDDEWTEAVRGLRTALFAGGPTGSRIVQFTSATPGEGVTSTTLALARSLSRSGQRVLLADADLRHPHLHDDLGLPLAPGLTDVLSGAAELDSVVAGVDGDPGVSVVTAGTPSAAAGDLIASDAFRSTLVALAATADVALVDTPSSDSVSDAQAIASVATDVVLVVAHGGTTRESVAQAVARLTADGRPLAGVVVTHGARPRGTGAARSAKSGAALAATGRLA